MSKTARQAATGYRPSGRQCAECHYAKHDCSGLEFDQTQPPEPLDARHTIRLPASVKAKAQRIGAAAVIAAIVAAEDVE